MTDRELILANVPTIRVGRENCNVGDPKIRNESTDLWTQFQKRFSALGGEVIQFEQINNVAQTFYVDANIDIKLPIIIDDVWSAEAGITRADCAIAETGSIIVSAKSGLSRLASLAPPIHIVLIDQKNIVSSLEEGVNSMSKVSSVIITGPSRTADIEGVLVCGVHGPKRIIIALLP